MQDYELLDVLGTITTQSFSEKLQIGVPESSLVNTGQTLVNIAPVIQLSKLDSVVLLAQEMSKELLGLVLRPTDEIDLSLSMA